MKVFFEWREQNDLQFSLMVEVLPSHNSKNGSLCRGCKFQENQYHLQSLEAMMYGDRKCLQTSGKSLS